MANKDYLETSLSSIESMIRLPTNAYGLCELPRLFCLFILYRHEGPMERAITHQTIRIHKLTVLTPLSPKFDPGG